MLAELRRSYAAGHFAQVVARARELGALLEADPEALVLAANAAIQSGALQEAETWLSILRRLHRDDARLRRIHASVLNRRAALARSENRGDDARALLSAALTIDPANPEARFNLAIEWRHAGRDDFALPLLLDLQASNPHDEAVNLNLAECLLRAGNRDAVAALLNSQAAIGFREKARWLRTALEAHDDQHWPALLGGEPSPHLAADFAVSFVLELVEQHRRDDAVRVAAIARDCYSGRAPLGRCMLAALLHPGSVADSPVAVASERQRWLRALDEIEACWGTGLQPALSQLSWSNFALAYHGCDDLIAQSRYGDWLAARAKALRPDLGSQRQGTNRERPRVALVSSHWRRCTVGHYFYSWVETLAADSSLDVHVLAIGPRFDDLTDAIERLDVEVGRVDGECDADAIAERLHSLGADLIIYPELGMDVRLLPVAALRLAPLQVMAWGHPVTSGLPTIDAYISCAAMEPPEARAHYREQLCLLPDLGTAYYAPQRPAPGSRSELGLHEGPLVVVPQSGVKIHPDNDAIYAELLARQPTAKLLFFKNESETVTRQLHQRLARSLPSDAMARVFFHPLCSREHFLRVLGACDLMLDTLHWSGGNTSLDALRVGLPIITAPGAYMRGRQSAAMLRQLGLERELVTSSAALARSASNLLQEGRLPELSRRIDAGFDRLIEGRAALLELVQVVHRLLEQNRQVLS